MRRTATVVIHDEKSRDYGKTFIITEMAASIAEEWADRAILAFQRGGIDIPPNMAALGFIGIASVGLRMFGGLQTPEVLPLFQQLMSCVQICPEPRTNPNFIRPLVDNGTAGEDIEEVKTRWLLKAEVFALHAGFTSRGDLWTWISEQERLASRTTETSPDSSAPSSPPS
jgi:hypothetical protein